MGKTWDAVIDLFSEGSIPIRNMERASGFIATEMMNAAGLPTTYFACGSSYGTPILPTHASYNVVVRGDSARSSVRVNMRYVVLRNVLQPAAECVSTGTWEGRFEDRVRTRAEGAYASESRSVEGNRVTTVTERWEKATVASAGPILGVETGTTVRVLAPSVSRERISGTVVGWRGDTLFVGPEPTRAEWIIPRRSITRLELGEVDSSGLMVYRRVTLSP